MSVREAGMEAARRTAAGEEIAFLFGGERSGLSNEDVLRCRYAAEIPANPEYSSLNLSHAVQLAGYELRRALLDRAEVGALGEDAERIRVPAGHEHVAGLMRHARRVLALLGLPKHRDGPPVLPRLRRLIQRAEPNESEVNLLRGILRAAEEKTREKSGHNRNSGPKSV